jgi:hypothetical protein
MGLRQHSGAEARKGCAMTPKEEAFCRAVALEGKGSSDAYRASRDCSRMTTATINANAKKLARKPRIKARIEELRRESQESRESPTSSGQAAASPEQAEGPATHGRPTVYTPEIDVKIVERLAAGAPLRSICRDEGMPDESTVRRWALDENHPFFPRYARARELGFWSMADEILEIADDSRNDYMEKVTKSGNSVWVLNEEAINRARLRIQARQWLLSKALPKSFGEKVEITTPPKDRVQREWSDLEIARRLTWALTRGARVAEKWKAEGRDLHTPPSPDPSSNKEALRH